MVQHLRGAIRNLETAREVLSATGKNTDYLDGTIPKLTTYMEDISTDDPYLSAMVLFFTQQHAYSGRPTNPLLKRDFGIESTEEMQRILDGYVEKGMLVSYTRTHRSGKTNPTYKLSPTGYELSLKALRERAEADEINIDNIHITEIGLSPTPLNHLVRIGEANLGGLLMLTENQRRIPHLTNPKHVKEILDKVEPYRERMQRS